MSLTSCFKYAIELPESTLTQLLRSVIAQADTADLPLTYEPEDPIEVDGHTARISARLIDSDDQPSAFELTLARRFALTSGPPRDTIRRPGEAGY